MESRINVVPTDTGVRFERTAEPEPTGQAYVQPQRAKTTRELEMEAGARRVAVNAEQVKNRPPRIISDKERQAEGFNTAVFRPNSLHADRVIGNNGSAVSQHLGAMMRKVGSAKPVASGVETSG